MELVSFGSRERGKEGEKEMIKARRKTARGAREGGRAGEREREGVRWEMEREESERQHSAR